MIFYVKKYLFVNQQNKKNSGRSVSETAAVGGLAVCYITR